LQVVGAEKLKMDSMRQLMQKGTALKWLRGLMLNRERPHIDDFNAIHL